MPSSKQQDKVPALVYDVPGAAKAWHWVAGLGTAWAAHPDIPVPHHNAEAFVKRLKDYHAECKAAWDAFEADQEAKGFRPVGPFPWVDPGVPVKLVYVTEAEAEAGRQAQKQGLESAPDDVPAAVAGGQED